MLNKGISFGVFPGISWLVVAFFWLLVLYMLWRSKGYLEKIGLTLILVGGGSNLLFRYLVGGVVDNWSLAGMLYNNLADYLIVIGLVVYGYSNFVRRRGDSRRR
jgi:lipoprotein signal peptidase